MLSYCHYVTYFMGFNMSYNVAFTRFSRNAKTGPIPVSTTTYETCPIGCPLRDNGCYGSGGPLGMFWAKVTSGSASIGWQAFLKSVSKLPKGTLWRHNQAGDLPSRDKINIDSETLSQLVKANKGKRGFTYTHYDILNNETNKQAIKKANELGFRINLSANNLEHADRLYDTGIAPVVTILPESAKPSDDIITPQGRKVVICPATYRDDVTCMSCGICSKERKAIIGFPVHGVQKRNAKVVANS